jgi:hypothetical protein
MSYIAQRVIRQHGFLVALVTAASVFVATAVQNALSTLVAQFDYLSGGDAVAWIGDVVGRLGESLFGSLTWAAYLPFGIGILASLWFVAPIAPQLRLGHVITRSLLAAAIGAVLIFPVEVIVSVAKSVSGSPGNLGDPALWLKQLRFGATTAIGQFIALAPLVILAGVLLWLWLERHPSKHDVSGIVDQA